MQSRFQRFVVVALFNLVLGLSVASARPIPTGMGTTTVSYMTHHGPVSFSGDRNYAGTGPASATPLGSAPNVAAFNSVNSFGRRPLVETFAPGQGAIRSNESLVTNAFFKINNNGDYFPGLEHHGDVTIRVDNMTFSEPVFVQENTFMFHTFWLSSQVDQFPPAETYLNIHNHHTAAVNFRNLDLFESSGVFAHSGGGHHHGGENAGFGDVHPIITGDGTAGSPLSIELTVPYHLFANLEQMNQAVPPGLPGPQGFLEPFHFHMEYVVVPEPATLGLLGVTSLFMVLRRRKP